MLTLEDILTYISENLNKQSESFEEKDILSQFKNLEYGSFQNLEFLDGNFMDLLIEFKDHLCRFGVLHNEKINLTENVNISLYFALLLIIKPEIRELTKEQQIQHICKFTEKLLIDNSAYDFYKKYNYSSYNWEKNDLILEIKKFIIGKRIIKFLADYLCVNIWVLNFESDEIQLAYCNDSLNRFRNNIIIFYNKSIYEPVSYNKLFVLPYTSNIIQHFYTNISDIFPLQFDFSKTIEFFTNTENLTIASDNIECLSMKKEIKPSGNDNWLIAQHNYELKKMEKIKLTEQEQLDEKNKLNDKTHDDIIQKISLNAINIKPINIKSINTITEDIMTEDIMTTPDKLIKTKSKLFDKSPEIKQSDINISNTSNTIITETVDPNDTETDLQIYHEKAQKIFKKKINIQVPDDLDKKNIKTSIKMKLDVLQQIATENNIQLQYVDKGRTKYKTKEQLINEISLL